MEVSGFPDKNQKKGGSEHLLQVGPRDNGKGGVKSINNSFMEFCHE